MSHRHANVRTPVTYTLTDGTPYQPSIFQRILDEWYGRLQEMCLPAYTSNWLHVTSGPVDHLEHVAGNAVGIYPQNEKHERGAGWCMTTARVGIDFWYKRFIEDLPHRELARMDADLQRLFSSDNNTVEQATGDQLSVSVRPLATQFDIESPRVSLFSGYKEIEIKYRTRVDDPRVLV